MGSVFGELRFRVQVVGLRVKGLGRIGVWGFQGSGLRACCGLGFGVQG